MDDLAALTHQFEYLFLKRIVEGLRNKNIDIAQAKEYAKSFLAIEPFTSVEDAHEKILKFTEENEIFTELKSYVNSREKEKEDLLKIDKMRQHIRQNDIDAALAAAKT